MSLTGVSRVLDDALDGHSLLRVLRHLPVVFTQHRQPVAGVLQFLRARRFAVQPIRNWTSLEHKTNLWTRAVVSTLYSFTATAC